MTRKTSEDFKVKKELDGSAVSVEEQDNFQSIVLKHLENQNKDLQSIKEKLGI